MAEQSPGTDRANSSNTIIDDIHSRPHILQNTVMIFSCRAGRQSTSTTFSCQRCIVDLGDDKLTHLLLPRLFSCWKGACQATLFTYPNVS